jgi:hypothetical protein
MDNNGSQQERGRTPPYVSFKSFTTLLEDFKSSGVPPRIDRSVLKRFSGGLGSQLLVALRSLGLMDDNGTPTDDLQILVDYYGTDDYPSGLRHVLETSYPFLQTLDLTTATPSMFAEAFQSATTAKEDVLRKCRTFYLHAAKVAGIEIGKRLESGTYTRTAGAGRKRRKQPRADGENAGTVNAADNDTSSTVDRFKKELLAKFPEFDPSWPDEIKAKWFAGFDQFMTMAKK